MLAHHDDPKPFTLTEGCHTGPSPPHDDPKPYSFTEGCHTGPFPPHFITLLVPCPPPARIAGQDVPGRKAAASSHRANHRVLPPNAQSRFTETVAALRRLLGCWRVGLGRQSMRNLQCLQIVCRLYRGWTCAVNILDKDL